MAVTEIVKYPSPILKKKSKAVKKIELEITSLIEDMIDTMHAAPGIGLAAPQVGKSIRLIVFDIGDGPIEIVNPKIRKRSGQQVFVEGCLSVPNLEAPVTRSGKVTVTGMNRKGQEILIKGEGLLATVLQHEIDHLDGKLFIDRVSDPSDIRTVTKEKARERDNVCLQDRSEECMM